MLSSLQECHPFLAELIHVWAITQIFSFSRDYEWYYVKKLGEGGFKRVFECRRENEVAAISVMEPRESGLRNVAQLELRCLLLLSLVREKMRGETTEQWRSERWSHRKMRCDWWLESHGEESEGQSVEPHISF